MKRLNWLLLVAGLAVVPTPISAQEQGTDEDVFEALLYTPELVMQHRRAIDLNDEQRDAISRMIQELQGRVVSLQWEMLDQLESLQETLAQGSQIDQDRALDQLDRVLQTEKEIKQAHLELLIRIKNVLTAEQQGILDGLKEPGASDER